MQNQDHVVILSQKLGSMLTLIPSDSAIIKDVMRIVYPESNLP